jgi:uncharacterized protein (TIGR02118 family)
LTWEEFSAYWREQHAPLVRANAETLGIRRYVQVRTVREPKLHAGLQARNGGAPPPFDGIAEIWLDGVDDMRRPSTDAGRRAAAELLEDERRFIDLASSPMWIGEEWEVVPSEM